MDAYGKACQELLAMTLHLFPLLIFAQRGRKTKISTVGRESNVFGTELGRGASETTEVPEKENKWCSFLKHKQGVLHWPTSVNQHLSLQTFSKLNNHLNLNQSGGGGSGGVSWQALFWESCISTCLPVFTTECCLSGRRGVGSEALSETQPREGHLFLSNDSLSHRP